jgi:predicted 2-oxoglutarate/Fe(II)-dependent dioxygenase YbiX
MTDYKFTPTRAFNGCIEIYENIWDNSEETISLIENECSDTTSIMEWSLADVRKDGYESVNATRTNLHTGITYYAEKGNKSAQKLHNKIASLLVPLLEEYMYRYRILGIQYHHEFYNMLKYSNNQKFDAHVDGLPGSDRFLSCVLYLNDNYIGGELEFVNFDLKLKMPKASLIVFPSNYSHAHIAHPVTSGIKYAIVAWLALNDQG